MMREWSTRVEAARQRRLRALICRVLHLTIMIGGVCGMMASPASAQVMTALAHNRIVGRLTATDVAGRIAIDYAVRDNGRGPTSRETIVLGPDGLPTQWTIDATTLVGAPVRETMRRHGGALTWVSDSDRGTVHHAALYFANNASPYALGLYARAALAAPGRQIAVAPIGTLRIDDLGPAPGALGAAAQGGRIYRLSGPWMTPPYVVLSPRGELLATTADGATLVKTGLEAAVPALSERLRELDVTRMRDLQSRLAHRFDTPVHIRNVHVFDPRSGTRGPRRIVTFYRDRIVAIQADNAATRGAMTRDVVIDGEGGTLIPGLRDMHSHTSLASGLYNLAAGVTSTRDMGNDPAFLDDLLPRLDSGELPGPRVTKAGFIEGVSPYSASSGMLAPTLDAAIADIGTYAWHDYRQIKIYNSIPAGWVRPMAAEAHRLGLGVTGHIPAFMTADQAIRDGYDEVAHINQLMFQWVLGPTDDTRTSLRLTAMDRFATIDLNGPRVAETLALMRAHDTALDTTISTQERIALSRAGRSQRGELPYLDHVPIAYQRYRKRDIVPVRGLADEARYEKAVDTMVALIGRLHAQGTRLLPGTDDGYGVPIHRELELYAMAGISSAETLAIDVLRTAEYLGQSESLGTIERGKLADMVLLRDDPTADISAVRTARMVVRGGTVYYPDEIYDALSIRPFATRPPVRLPTATTGAAEVPATVTEHQGVEP